MLLTISTTHSPATDLGYLLHKHPDRCQTFDLSFGRAQVFYSEATVDRCTAVLLLEIDPVRLVRGKSGSSLEQYVNDRPYVASSFLSVAIAQIFGSALSGRSHDRPDLVTRAIPLRATLSMVPCRQGQNFLHQLFEPLGYAVKTTPHSLDEQFSEWGESRYFSVELDEEIPLKQLLSHLYVLIPVLDEDKHYWVGEEEIEKLLRHGDGWLATHPEKVQITRQYLKRERTLTQSALSQLIAEETPNLDIAEDTRNQEEVDLEKSVSLNQQRLETVTSTLKQCNVKRVIDLGCGEGNLLRVLAKDNFFEQITGIDVSYRSLETAQKRLDQLLLGSKQRERIQLMQGALTYRDRRFNNYEGATLIEVIEHLDLPRLAALERVVFEFAHPKVAIVTTPNVEYNVKFPALANGTLRHKDHRFEWTRQEFQTWANRVAQQFRYTVRFEGIGNSDPIIGSPTQMAIFEQSVL